MVRMNGASLIADFTSNDVFKNPGASSSYVLSEKNIYSLSSGKNIVVLLVDRLDNKFIEETIEADSSFKEKLEKSLDGFTYYTDAVSLFNRTYPSVPYLLSGIEYLGQCSAKEYLRAAYKNSNFLNDLRLNGYSVNLYLTDYETSFESESLIGIADNAEKVTGYDELIETEQDWY